MQQDQGPVFNTAAAALVHLIQQQIRYELLPDSCLAARQQQQQQHDDQVARSATTGLVQLLLVQHFMELWQMR